MSSIQKIIAREVLDSRGLPTIEVDVITQNNCLGRASVPSGASTGSFEALELRDEDSQRYNGKGVQKAINGIHQVIAPTLIGMDVTNQTQIDHTLLELDSTPNKSKLGANSLLAVSLSCLKAAATEAHQNLFEHVGDKSTYKLPVPLINILNGGAHANNGLDVQEFMIVPLKDSFSTSLMAGSEIFHSLKKLLCEKNLSTAVGDEGGFAPPLKSNKQALELISLAIERTKYKLGEDIFLALDVAATELAVKKKNSHYLWEGQEITASDLMSIYESWQKSFPLISIEDAFSEDDWNSWSQFTKKITNNLQLIGDDLFVTHPERLKIGIEKKAANAILIKLNQIGTVTETIQTIQLAKSHGYKTIISHRSGETEDCSIADLAVGLSCQQIKTGSVCRSERLAKYNQLLRIEEFLGDKAEYWGSNAFS